MHCEKHVAYFQILIVNTKTIRPIILARDAYFQIFILNGASGWRGSRAIVIDEAARADMTSRKADSRRVGSGW